jgi:NOL1/NOP2/fmu family ribosome biogenesis protein
LPASITTQSADGLKGLNVNLETFYILIKKAARATVELQPGKFRQVLSGLVIKWENHTNSYFPLNNKSTMLDQLKLTGVIIAKLFALNVGSQTSLAGRGGRLALGG